MSAKISELTAASSPLSAADVFPVLQSGANRKALIGDIPLTALAGTLTVAKGGTGATTAAAARTALGLVIGTDVQAQDAELAAIAGLVSAADKLPFFTGLGAAALADLTSYARALIAAASAAAARTVLGLGTAALAATGDFEAAGAISTHAALTSGVHGISAFGATLIDDANAGAARTTLGLGTAATAATGDFEAAGAIATHAGVTSGVHGISAFAATILDDANAAAVRATIGAGTGSGDALTSGTLAQFASTTSAQLAGVISDETGSGALVFATSPTLVTPNLGTPASGTLTNCTGLPAAGVTGLAAIATSGSAADLSAGTIPAARMPALTGDVTTSAGAVATTIAANAVSDAKFRQSAALSVVGNATNGTANVADIAAGSDHQVLRRSGTALAFGALNLASANAVTGDLPLANLAPSGAASKLLGRGDSGAGDWQEITIGAGLTMSGTTLSAASGSTPTGTGFRHVTSGSEDAAAKLVEDADVHASAAIALSKLATIADGRILGNNSGGAGVPLAMTGAQATALLSDFVGDSGSGGTKGLVPAPAAGDGAARKALLASGVWGRFIQVDVFTANGTWTKPTGITHVRVIAIGGGGGGGGGRRGAAGSTRGGGGSGASGAAIQADFMAADLGATETVTVGAAGTGATGTNADDTDGSAGSAGGDSSFGLLLKAKGGGAGGGGTTSGGTAGTGGGAHNDADTKGVNGTAGGTGGGAGGNGNSGQRSGGAGGAGAGINSGNTSGGGGAGGIGHRISLGTSGSGGGGGGGANNGGNGTDATDRNSTSAIPGDGGGGGGSHAAGAGGDGGDGAEPGGGGGGGGACVNGNQSGDGGDGGVGRVIVISFW